LVDENVIVQIFLVAISAITAIIIWRKMTESNKITRESTNELKISNDLLTLELKEKFSPRFVFDKCRIQYESDKTNFANFNCIIKNMGLVSLSDVSISSDIQTHRLSLYELIKKENDIKKSTTVQLSTLATKTAIQDYSIRFEEERGKPIFVIAWISYHYLDERKEEAIFLLHFEDLQYKGFNQFTHVQIQNAKKI